MQKDRIDSMILNWKDERPELPTEALEIVLRIQSLAKRLANSLTDQLNELDLEWWEYDVLSVLRRQGKPYQMTASEIAENTMLSSGAMTNRIDGLVERKFVRRIEDKKDRRKVIVELCTKGQDYVDRATDARFRCAENALKDLGQLKQKQLSNLLRTMVLSNPTPTLK